MTAGAAEIPHAGRGGAAMPMAHSRPAIPAWRFPPSCI